MRCWKRFSPNVPQVRFAKDFPHVRCVCDVFEEYRVGVARSRRAGITDDWREGTSQKTFEESGDVLVVRFAILGVIGTDLDGL